MYRLFKVGLVVAAALAFTVLMIAGDVSPKPGFPIAVHYFCAYLMWPGVTITVDWLHTPLGDNFFARILFFNTLIYSVVFGLLFRLLGSIRRRHKSEG